MMIFAPVYNMRNIDVYDNNFGSCENGNYFRNEVAKVHSNRNRKHKFCGTKIKNLTSFSKFFRVLPRGPISSPTKLMSGCSSWGIITLSLTRITGGLKTGEDAFRYIHILYMILEPKKPTYIFLHDKLLSLGSTAGVWSLTLGLGSHKAAKQCLS